MKHRAQRIFTLHRLPALAVLLLGAAVVTCGAAAPSTRADTPPPFAFVSDSYPLPAIGPADLPFAAKTVAPRVDPGYHDDQGVRMRIVDGKPYDYPGGQASWGMANLNSYLITGDEFYLERARAQAQRLIDTSLHHEGAWFFPSMYTRDRHARKGDRMQPPWFGCLGQGAGLALFCRLYEETGDPRYSEAAGGAFAAFLQTGPVDAPWLVTIDDDGYLWFEEWPKRPVDHTLNGHGFAAFGVYEYWRVFGDEQARALFCGAATTVRHYLPSFRRPGWVSRYCLLHGSPNRKYHVIHTDQLLKLYTLTGDARFARLADTLSRDFPDPAATRGRLRVGRGAHAAFLFRAGGEIIGRRTLRVRATRTRGIAARQRVRGRGVFVQLASGGLRGYWLRERPGIVYTTGAAATLKYVPSRRLTLEAGRRYVGRLITAGGRVTGTRSFTPAETETVAVSSRAVVNGVDRLLVTGGALDGSWLPAAGLRLQ